MKKEIIQGKVISFLRLTAEQEHCFYDIEDDNRNYMTSIDTPLISDEEIERKYIPVQGNADELNNTKIEEYNEQVD